MQQDINSPIYIVTGATGAIGSEIAKVLSAKGLPVMLACRNISKAEALKSKLENAESCGEILTGRLSLESFSDIRTFADNVKSLNRPIAALINNAGVMRRYYNRTIDGIEQTLAVNYLGTVLLSELLFPTLEYGGSITFTTSITRKLHSLKEQIIQEPAENFSQLGTYGRTKLALTHYALYMSQRDDTATRNIRINCADPGIVNTSMITMQRWYDPLANIFFRPFISSPAQGATSALNATSNSLNGQIFKHNHHPHPIESDLRHSDAKFRQTLVKSTQKILNL